MRILITVKAYPQLSSKYHETVCVAGIELGGQVPRLVRLFPVPYRDLPREQQFTKYDVIEVDVHPHSQDRRPESLRPVISTLRIVGHLDTKDAWKARAANVSPLVVESMCEITRRQQSDGTSLGVFRPGKVLDFRLVKADPKPASWEAMAGQMNLFDQERETLEALPWRFVYKFRCDDSTCPPRGHTMGLVDWEVGQTYRHWREKYPEEQLPERLREKWLEQMGGPTRDLHFFVGNIGQHPKTFMLLGVFYPPVGAMDAATLF